MNSKAVGIIVCGVVAASLAGVMVLLNATGGDKEPDTSSSETGITQSSKADESVIILEKESDQIASLHVDNASGGFDLIKDPTGKTVWTIEQLSGLLQNTTQKNGMITILGQLEAKKLVEAGVSEWDKFGLEEPQASVTITYTDGSTETMDIGDPSPESRYSYVRLRSANNVYLMLGTKLSYFTDRAEDYAELGLIATPSDDDWPEYGIETVSRKDWDYEAVFENDPHNVESMLSSQCITSPIFAYLNITGSTAVTHGMWGLTAASCELIHPTEEQLAEYGITDPDCTVSLKGDSYDYLLRIGNAAEGTDDEGNLTALGRYCYLEGVTGEDAVYIIAESNLPWLTFKIEDVITSLMTTNYLVDLSSLTVEVGSDKTVYDITPNGGSEDSFPDGGYADVTGVKANGKDVDVYNFKSLYQYIMSCPTNELCFDDPVGDWEVRLTQTRKDGGQDVVELYKDTSRRYIVKLNGVPSYRIQSTWIDTLKKNIDNLEKGIEIDDNY